MKKILLIVFFALIVSHVHSQSFRFGAKAGLNISHLGTDIEKEANSIFTGYQVGIVGSIDLQEFGIQPELQYSVRGGKVTIPNASLEEKYEYLELPIAIKYYFGDHWNFHFGTYFSILIAATQTETVNGDPIEVNLDELITPTDYGFLAGIGYDFDPGITLTFRYNYGMKDVDSQANVERRHRFGQFSVTYFFLR